MSAEPPPILNYQADNSSISRWDIAFLGCRLFAVYCVLQLAGSLSYAGVFVTQSGRDPWVMVWFAMAVAIHVSAMIVLWTQAGRFAGWMLADASAAGATAGPAAASIQAIAISLIGLIIAVRALPRVVVSIGQSLQYEGGTGIAIEGVIHLALGVALFLGAKGLSRLWYRFRTAGLQPPHRPEEQEPPRRE